MFFKHSRNKLFLKIQNSCLYFKIFSDRHRFFSAFFLKSLDGDLFKSGSTGMGMILKICFTTFPRNPIDAYFEILSQIVSNWVRGCSLRETEMLLLFRVLPRLSPRTHFVRNWVHGCSVIFTTYVCICSYIWNADFLRHIHMEPQKMPDVYF